MPKAADTTNAPNQNSPIMTVPQLAEYLDVGRSAIYDLAARDEIPHFHVGRFLRFNRADIDEWARGHEHHREDLYRGRKASLLTTAYRGNKSKPTR